MRRNGVGALQKGRGVVFDVGGTLFTYGDMETAWSDWLEALYSSLVPHGLNEPIEALAGRCDGFFSASEPPHVEGLTVFGARVRRLATEAGLSIPTADLAAIEDSVVAAWWAHLTLDPEATDVLRFLSTNHWLALVSNFDHPKHLREILTHHRLTQFFGAVVISGEVGFKKPDPRIMFRALDSLGLRPESCVHVGDVEDDERCAASAGMRAITIDRHGSGPEPSQLDFGAVSGKRDAQAKVPWKRAERIRTLGELPALLSEFSEVVR